MLIIFVCGIDKTAVYGGCVAVSALIHYFTLVAVMFMGAEAVLMFQKLVIVFGSTSTKFFVTVSLICWCKCTTAGHLLIIINKCGMRCMRLKSSQSIIKVTGYKIGHGLHSKCNHSQCSIAPDWSYKRWSTDRGTSCAYTARRNTLPCTSGSQILQTFEPKSDHSSK